MKTIVCKNCGGTKEVEAWRNIEYCSRKCSAIYLKSLQFPKEKRICKNCNEEFDFSPTNGNGEKGIFCSSVCHHTYVKENPKYVSAICLNCKKEFPINSHIKNQKYCSPECSYKHKGIVKKSVLSNISIPPDFKRTMSLTDLKNKLLEKVKTTKSNRFPHELTLYKIDKDLYYNLMSYPFKGKKLNFQNRIYLSMFLLKDVPTCVLCGKEVSYSLPSQKWATTCSKSCRNKLQTNLLSPNFNRKACEVFKELDILLGSISGVDSRYALYGNGEQCVLNLYWLDYINSKEKIIIEWQERQHTRTLKSDAWKRKRVKELYPEYKYITIWEKEFNKGTETVESIYKKCNV